MTWLYVDSDGYPVVTRSSKWLFLFGNSPEVPRFGTEGSEVQILSPRPILINKIGLPSTVIVG